MKPLELEKGKEIKNKIAYLRDLESITLPGGQKKRFCEFRCGCGKNFNHNLRPIIRGITKNCGCGHNTKRQIHGLTGSKIRRCWSHIKTRCYNEDSHAFSHYGGRGISVYEGWLNDFNSFYSYVSALPYSDDKHRSLDRVNNDGNYEPGNLRWATHKEQANNKRPRCNSRSTIKIKKNGKKR